MDKVYHAVKITGVLEALLHIAKEHPGLSIADFIKKALIAINRDGPGCGCQICKEDRADLEEWSGLKPAVAFGWLTISADGHVYWTGKE